MKALGLDPGPTKTGAAYVRFENGWMNIDMGGHFENSSDELRKLMQRAAMAREPIAVECIVGYAYEHKRMAALIETARVEGRLLERAEGLGTSALTIEAGLWRGSLCGAPGASDEQIRIAIEGVTKTWPKVLAVARPHLFDAAGVAIAAIGRALGRTISAPPAVMWAVEQQRQAEKASRGARKAAALPVVEAGKRSETRAQRERRGAASKRGWAGRKAGG